MARPPAPQPRCNRSETQSPQTFAPQFAMGNSASMTLQFQVELQIGPNGTMHSSINQNVQSMLNQAVQVQGPHGMMQHQQQRGQQFSQNQTFGVDAYGRPYGSGGQHQAQFQHQHRQQQFQR